ncbi:MAG: hypothetical protein ABSC17_04575 [Thermacetogeniaceae bacterium]
MAVALRNIEEPERGKDARLHLVAAEQGKMAGNGTERFEYPYYDLYQMYGYITKELGIK